MVRKTTIRFAIPIVVRDTSNKLDDIAACLSRWMDHLQEQLFDKASAKVLGAGSDSVRDPKEHVYTAVEPRDLEETQSRYDRVLTLLR